MKRFIFLISLAFIIAGCAHVIPKEERHMAEDIPIPLLFKDPDAYAGRLVIIGGNIISSINTEEGTYIEVLQKSLDYRGRPEETDVSAGRFIIFYKGYLDTAIYSRGREITVFGEIMGKRIRTLGEILYPYLMINGKKLYLFEPRGYIPIRFGIEVWKTF